MALSKFQKMIADLATQAETTFARITDKAAFKRIIFASFLIARADGNFDSDEKTALARIINKDFPQFKLTDIIDTLSEAQEKLDFDVTLGTGELMQEIGKATGDEAAAIVRTACFIGAADGDFDNDEKAVTRNICKATNQDPADFGL